MIQSIAKYQKCAISCCKNNYKTTPKKLLFHAPREYSKRGLWIYTTGKNYKHSSTIVVCEDHFNLQEDTDYLNNVGKPVLKKDVIPHRNLEEIGQSAAGRSSTSVNIFFVDKECQTDFVDELSRHGVKRKQIDASTSTSGNTLENSSDSSKPEESSGSVYVPDTDENETETESEDDSEIESEDTLDELDEEFQEDDDSDVDCLLNTCEKKMICKLTIKTMKSKIQHYTGIPQSSAYIIDLIVERKLMSERNLFLVLRKIRHDESLQILGDLFGVSRQQAGHIFTTCIETLAFHLKPFVYWPSLIDVKLNLPLQFKHKFKNVESIFDCFETAVAKPRNPVDQALSWSQYKHANTLKHLISSTPDGMINFNSKGCTGRISDYEMVKRSGFLNNIKPGSESMADRGFKDVKIAIEERGGVLHKPPSTQAGLRFTKEEAKLCKSVAATRIHIERVIKKVRDFDMLKPHRASVPSKRTFLMEYAVIVASGICNMQSYLTKI